MFKESATICKKKLIYIKTSFSIKKSDLYYSILTKVRFSGLLYIPSNAKKLTVSSKTIHFT